MGKQEAEAIHVHINKLERSYWVYLMMSCDGLRYIFFNEYTLEIVLSSLSSTQKETVEQLAQCKYPLLIIYPAITWCSYSSITYSRQGWSCGG